MHNAPESNKNVMVARVLTQQMIWVIRAVFILIYRLLIVGSSGTSKITILVKFNKNLAIRGDPLIRRNYAIYSISTFPTSSILSCVNKSSQNILQKLRQTISEKRKIHICRLRVALDLFQGYRVQLTHTRGRTLMLCYVSNYYLYLERNLVQERP